MSLLREIITGSSKSGVKSAAKVHKRKNRDFIPQQFKIDYNGRYNKVPRDFINYADKHNLSIDDLIEIAEKCLANEGYSEKFQVVDIVDAKYAGGKDDVLIINFEAHVGPQKYVTQVTKFDID